MKPITEHRHTRILGYLYNRQRRLWRRYVELTRERSVRHHEHIRMYIRLKWIVAVEACDNFRNRPFISPEFSVAADAIDLMSR